MRTAYCDPRLHDDVRTPADWYTTADTGPANAAAAHSSSRTSYACCDAHLPFAIAYHHEYHGTTDLLFRIYPVRED